VVVNLVGNAVKFTPPGGRIDVTVRRDGALTRLAVSDTGRGIEPALLAVVFDPFRQADSPTKRVQAGLGLGLAIVRSEAR
jgi:signal transduction histidine kinase